MFRLSQKPSRTEADPVASAEEAGSADPGAGGDARAVAMRLIARLGERAISHAMQRALAARHAGELAQLERWHWIAGAAREILRSEPQEDESRRVPAAAAAAPAPKPAGFIKVIRAARRRNANRSAPRPRSPA